MGQSEPGVRGTTQADARCSDPWPGGLGAERKGSVKTPHKGKLIRPGNSLKVEDEAIKDDSMVSRASSRKSGWGTQFYKEYERQYFMFHS